MHNLLTETALIIRSKKPYLCWHIFFRLMSKTGMFSSGLKAATKLVPLSTPAEVGAFPCPAPKPTGAHQQPGTALGGV